MPAFMCMGRRNTCHFMEKRGLSSESQINIVSRKLKLECHHMRVPGSIRRITCYLWLHGNEDVDDDVGGGGLLLSVVHRNTLEAVHTSNWNTGVF